MLNRSSGDHGHVFSVPGATDDYASLRDVIGRVSELVQFDGD